MGFEQDTQVNTGIGFASEKGNRIIGEMMMEYQKLQFNPEILDKIACPIINTRVLTQHGLKTNGKMQQVEDLMILPLEYLCPESMYTGQTNYTENTVSIHHYSASWMPAKERIRMKAIMKIKRILPNSTVEAIRRKVRSNRKVICGTIIALLFLAQAFLYNTNGTKILKIFGFSYGTIQIVIRNAHIRLIAVDLVSFSSILSIGALCSQDSALVNKKARYILNIVSILLYEIYCTRTRSTVLLILIVLLFTLMFSTKNSSLKKMAIFLLILAGVAVYWTEIYSFFTGMYHSLLQRTDWSVYHRFDSYLYYLSVLGKRPIFGNGLLRDTPSNSEYYHLVHGYKTYPFGYSDVGLIGTGAKFGVIGIAIYVYLIVRAFKNIKIDGKIDGLNLAIAVCMLISTINLSLFDAERLIVLAAFMAIQETRKYLVDV